MEPTINDKIRVNEMAVQFAMATWGDKWDKFIHMEKFGEIERFKMLATIAVAAQAEAVRSALTDHGVLVMEQVYEYLVSHGYTPANEGE